MRARGRPSRPIRARLPVRVSQSASPQPALAPGRTIVVVVVVVVGGPPATPWSGTVTWPPAGAGPTPRKAIGHASASGLVLPGGGSWQMAWAWSPESGSPSHSANVLPGGLMLNERDSPA